MVDVVEPYAWPSGLTFFAEHGSWQEGVEPGVLDFPVEFGPAKRRRRSFLVSTRVQFNRIISGDELQLFLAFFLDTLQSGVYNFEAIDPRTGDLTEYQFVQVPQWRDVTTHVNAVGDTRTYWKLTFTLRRINLPVVAA